MDRKSNDHQSAAVPLMQQDLWMALSISDGECGLKRFSIAEHPTKKFKNKRDCGAPIDHGLSSCVVCHTCVRECHARFVFQHPQLDHCRQK